MKGTGQALSHGAISILNAFSTGKGGALSIDLWTRAKVTLRDGSGEFSVLITSDPTESSALVVAAVKKTLERYGDPAKFSGEIITSSNIPSAVGLKSSSAAANAAALAAASALGVEPDHDTIIGIGIDASLESGVSLTGGFDDSYASYHGGAVLTDNLRRKVEKTIKVPSHLHILVLVPPRKTYTGTLDKSKFMPIRRISELAYSEASNGHLWDALTLNGLAYSSVLGEDPKPAITALEAGALGAGLSGKGPAVTAVVEEDDVAKVRKAWEKFPGRVLASSPNEKRAVIEG